MIKTFNRILIIILIASLVLSIPFVNTIPAIKVGDYYICTMEDWPLGTQFINESIEGQRWMYLYGKTSMTRVREDPTEASNKVFGYWINPGSNPATYCWAYFYEDFSIFALTSQYDGNPPRYNKMAFYSGSTKLFSLWHCYAGGPDKRAIILDENDVTLKNWKTPHTGLDQIADFSIVINPYNMSYGFFGSNESTPDDYREYWYESAEPFGFVTRIKFSWESGVAGTLQSHQIDNITILPGFIGSYPWEIDYPTFGSVTDSSSDYITHDFDPLEVIVDETQAKDVYNPGSIIKQVALAVDDSSDVADIEAWLRIGDSFLEQRSTYYTDSANDRLILVWQNMEVMHPFDDLDLEFKFATSGNYQMYPLYTSTDIDEDGDTVFKYTNNNSNFDGVYNGFTSIGGDLQYQVWHTLYGGVGDINISVYNESSLNNITDWNLTIWNKISGIVYYNESDLNNPLVINISDFGLGHRYFTFSKQGFHERTYYLYVENENNYTLDAYLVPVDLSELYFIQVVDNATEDPIFDARIIINRLINGSFKEVSSGFTNGYGLWPVFLIPEKAYYINISKSDYVSLVLQITYPDPVKFGIEFPIIFRLERESDDYVEVPDIRMDILVLSAHNATHMRIYYTNLNNDNDFVLVSVYDFIGDTLLTSYNVSDTPNEFNLYFNHSAYSLSGSILKVVATAFRTNDTIYVTTRYFDISQAYGGINASAAVLSIFSLGICLFGLTLAHPKKVFGVIGMIIMIIAIAMTAFATQTWYIHLVQAVEIILLIFIALVFREEGIHAV